MSNRHEQKGGADDKRRPIAKDLSSPRGGSSTGKKKKQLTAKLGKLSVETAPRWDQTCHKQIRRAGRGRVLYRKARESEDKKESYSKHRRGREKRKTGGDNRRCARGLQVENKGNAEFGPTLSEKYQKRRNEGWEEVVTIYSRTTPSPFEKQEKTNPIMLAWMGSRRKAVKKADQRL